MKNQFIKINIKSISVVAFFMLLLTATTVNAQKTKTSEFLVKGTCSMCEKRIEKAAMIKGVKMAEWDKETQMLKVVYNTKKTNENAIHTAVSNVGHDTEKAKAPDSVYGELPGCCSYREGKKCEHEGAKESK